MDLCTKDQDGYLMCLITFKIIVASPTQSSISLTEPLLNRNCGWTLTFHTIPNKPEVVWEIRVKKDENNTIWEYYCDGEEKTKTTTYLEDCEDLWRMEMTVVWFSNVDTATLAMASAGGEVGND